MAERDGPAVDVQPIGRDRPARPGRPAPGPRTPRSAPPGRCRRASARPASAPSARPAPGRCRRARAARPRWRRRRSAPAASARGRARTRPDTSTTAAAPSLVCDELPAVTVPAAWNAGASLAERLQRGVAPRALVAIDDDLAGRRRAAAGRRLDRRGPATGTISSAKRPASMAATARSCEASAKASCASREMFDWPRVVLGDQPGAEVDVGIAVDQRRVGRHLVAAHRDEAHRLGAAGDHRRAPAPSRIRSAP